MTDADAILLLSCPDQRWLAAMISNCIFECHMVRRIPVHYVKMVILQ
jgi:hypothetical protein